MNKFTAAALLMVMALVFLLGGWHGLAVGQPGLQKNRWEYAVMVRTANLATNETSISLRLPTKAIDARSFREMANELGKPIPEESVVASLNLLGDFGWDLVGYTERESLRDVRLVIVTWTFKRPDSFR